MDSIGGCSLGIGSVIGLQVFPPTSRPLELLSRSMLAIYEVDLLDQWFRCFSIRFLETLHSLNIRLHGVGSVPGFQAEKVTRLLQ